MHIPDGYLSPSTCAGLYAASAPFWYVALNRVKKSLHTRMVPLLSVFAAFSFVIMMFNLPLPGGTTGHAIGVGIAAIVLGPWASILAISVALLIQAVFFGDGGITAIGANSFNMAIAGSITAYVVYRIAAARAGIGSTRRMIAAGLAGYSAINVAALCAAIEFGIQPLFFRDATGAPLYAPYPLSVSIPAMMLGHLTFAGMAELIITAGMVAYLQRSDPALLKSTAPTAPALEEPAQPYGSRMLWPTARKLWLGLAVLLILTPLGILAVGSAWGEWRARDFSDPAARSQIEASSGGRTLPEQAPRGLERLSSMWTAPLSGYAPSFIRSESFGYFVSALVGVGLIIICGVSLSRLMPAHETSAGTPLRPRRAMFVNKTIAGILSATEHALSAEELARSNGLLQRMDARVKLAGLAALIAVTVSVRQMWVLTGVFTFTVCLALISRVPARLLATRVWIAVLAFTGAMALPAIFLTPGDVFYRLPVVQWTATVQGLTSACYLVLRAETAATLAALLVLCTLWTQVLRALRFFRVPVVAVVILGMTYRYIFLLLQTTRDMLESRQSRLVGVLDPPERRRLAAASAGVLLAKSFQLSAEVQTAMQARGFRGEVYVLDELRMHFMDWWRLAAFIAIASLALWLGR